MASTPICRCRVLYLGSAVPQITKDGLHGIQEPLRELYPDEGVLGAKGIDSWLSVWSNGLLLENVDEKHKRVTRFFPIESLHYCAAVRRVTIPGPDGDAVERFLPLDSPFARIPTPHNPPLFACILRRVAGIKVLECHVFVCKKEMAANALVRCCFHSYADNTYVKHLETGSVYGSVAVAPAAATTNGNGTSVNPIQKVEQWRASATADDSDASQNGELVSIYDGNENHKVWSGVDDQHSIYASSTLRSAKSTNGIHRSGRPRQLMSPSNPPPPPPNTTMATIESATNGKKRDVRKPMGRVANGHSGWRYPPMTASEFRPAWPAPWMKPMPPPQGYPVAVLPMSANQKKGPRMPIPVAPPVVPPVAHSPKSKSSEEPMYMPSSRAMSPVSSYQAAAFSYEQYYQNRHSPPTPPYGMLPPGSPAKPTKYKKKKDRGDSDSKFNTGIYRKKGHLNERAFSYSIRQEHRSRSHSSLATLSFAEPNAAVTNGHDASPDGPIANGHHHPQNHHHHHHNHHPQHPHNHPPTQNGKTSTLDLVRNGKGAKASPGSAKGKKAGKTGGINNMMNDLSLSDGELEELGSSNHQTPARRKATTATNHR